MMGRMDLDHCAPQLASVMRCRLVAAKLTSSVLTVRYLVLPRRVGIYAIRVQPERPSCAPLGSELARTWSLVLLREPRVSDLPYAVLPTQFT